MQLLGTVVALATIDGATRAMLMVENKTRFIFRRDMLFAVIKISLVSVGVIYWGLVGILCGIIIGRLVAMLIDWMLMKYIFDIKLIAQFGLIIRPILSCFVMYIALIVILPAIVVPEQTTTHQWFSLFGQMTLYAAIGVLVYSVTHFVLWFILGKPLGAEEKLVSQLKMRM